MSPSPALKLVPFHGDTIAPVDVPPNLTAARFAYAVMVQDNGEPTETEPRRFGFCTEEHDATDKLSKATLRTQLAASLLVNAGFATLSRDQWGEVLELTVAPEELQ